MSTSLTLPNENIASSVVASMTNEKVLSSSRLATGDQHFVFAVKTSNSEYVLRMTKETNRNYFISALYWQEKLIPLGVPLAKFISTDLDGKYSQFPALLMMRLPGDDLCNIYSSLTNLNKKSLAEEMVTIQGSTKALPKGLGFGITSSYEDMREVTLNEVFNDYIQVRKSLKKTTITNYKQILSKAFSNWGDKPLVSITKDKIAKHHEKLGNEHGEAYANLAMRVLRALFNFAAGQYEDSQGKSLITENPVKRLSQTRAWYRIERRQTFIKSHELAP